MRYTGNLLFQSMSVAQGFNNARKDDIESILYIMLYLLNDFKLPWTQYQEQLSNRQMTVQQIRDLRSDKQTVNAIKESLPAEFQQYYMQLIEMPFDEVPSYQGFIECMHRLQLRQQILHLEKATKKRAQ